MNNIIIVGAEQWCKSCKVFKDAVLPIAKELGIKVATVDLGARDKFHTNKGGLLDQGYQDFKSVPSVFINKELIDKPIKWDIQSIRHWLEEISK